MLDTPRRLWAAAAACAASFGVLLAVVYTTDRGAAADERALEGFGQLQRPRLAEIASDIARLCDPVPFAVAAAILVAIAFLRRRALLGATVGAILIGANVTTQVLKPLLAHPRGGFGEFHVGAEAFPSGHATAAMSLAVAAILVAPVRLRPLVALVGAGFALAVGFAIISLDYHFPSDVAGGYLVATGWCFGTLAAVRMLRRRSGRVGEQEPMAWWIAAAALLVPLAAAGWLALERLPRVTGYAEGHTTFAAVAAATAALAVLLVGSVLAVPDRR